jgi:hypothetical protein
MPGPPVVDHGCRGHPEAIRYLCCTYEVGHLDAPWWHVENLTRRPLQIVLRLTARRRTLLLIAGDHSQPTTEGEVMEKYEDVRADAVAFIERTRKTASRFAARGTPEAKERARLLRWRSTRMETTHAEAR